MGAQQVPTRHGRHEALDLLLYHLQGDGARAGPPDGDIARPEKRGRDGDFLPRKVADDDVLQGSLDVEGRQHVQGEVSVDVVENDVAVGLGEVCVCDGILLHDELVEALDLGESGLVPRDTDDLASAERLSHEGRQSTARARGPEDQDGVVPGQIRCAAGQRQPTAHCRVDAGGERHGVDALGESMDDVLGDGDELCEGPEAALQVDAVVQLARGDVSADAVYADVVRQPPRRVVLSGGAGADDLVEAGCQDAELDLVLGWCRGIIDSYISRAFGPVANLGDVHYRG